MVYGVRKGRDDESFFKRKGAGYFYRIMSYSTGVEVPPNAGDFRLMSRNVVEALKSMPERGRFMKGIYAWVGFNSIGVPFEVQDRLAGESGWSYRKLAGLALSGITSFTTMPLRLFGLLGIFISLLSILSGKALLPAPSGASGGPNRKPVVLLGRHLGRTYKRFVQEPDFRNPDSPF